MKNAIILHGSTDKEEYYSQKHPSMSNSHWLPWLQKQLLVRDIHAVTPEIPHCFSLDYATWKKEFERFDITEETLLVGHSCGGGFLVRWLSENKETKVGKVVLVAPWIDPDNEKGGQEDFFKCIIDRELATRTKGLTIFHSDDDMESVEKSVALLRGELTGAMFREFPNYGHFCIGDLKTDAFPELLEEVLNEQ